MKTGAQDIFKHLKILDSGFRRNDGKGHFQAFYEFVKLVDRRIYEGLARARSETRLYEKERPIAPQAPAGYPLSPSPRSIFRKAQRGRKKIASEDRRTTPAGHKRNGRLVVASKRAFLPGPWNDRAFFAKRPSVTQLIWR